eukprot:c32089_g1_i1.p1 GENE.c32089_g1_i1~~c32089_g1_i1.p1  ORF type:complete len:1071 (-),score=294.19 c32089_g1_i1:146-3337(-)
MATIQDMKIAFDKVVASSPLEVQAREALAEEFAALVSGAGLGASPLFVGEGQTESLYAQLSAKMISGSKAAAAEKQGAARVYGQLLKKLGSQFEAPAVKLLNPCMQMLVDKDRALVTAANSAIDALQELVQEHTVRAVIEVVLEVADKGKWQSQLRAVQVISAMVEKYPEMMARLFDSVIPVLSKLMWHDKASVTKASRETMVSLGGTLSNKDLEPFVPEVIECILNREMVDECIFKLGSTTFVQEVKSDALATIAPLLRTGLHAQASVATKRACARIIHNMAKLVDNPYEVAPFIPTLLPALARAKEDVPDPECRNVCEKAHDQLIKSADVSHAPHVLDFAESRALLLTAAVKPDEVSEFENIALDYAAKAVVSLVSVREMVEANWTNALTPILSSVWPKEAVSQAIGAVRGKMLEHNRVEVEEEEDREVLCDCNFSLAYGSKVLLNNTKLKLMRGAHYGLVGGNDCGKTTLMRAIANGQVEGFPDASEVLTVFVETDIPVALADLSVMEYIYADPLLKNCGAGEEDVAKLLKSVGFADDGPAAITKQVGRLSGGWRIKLSLVRAMLLKADILLLDEPSNHLDVMNRAWVIDYLKSLHNVTLVMVSHDTSFLDETCSHILHISNLKLRTYKGNLTAFVSEVPEASHYFQLKASDKYRFSFPVPGALEGVTSKGKHIMKMTNVTFTYPGADKAQLIDVSVRVSLSSRVACVGPNGAGKSTMIKILTGELVPDGGSGEVWKHPNCRVAYVAQHAFHHIEQHLEKTPNEYIRWRYQYGVDKEALQKEDMKFTDDELLLQREPVQVEVTNEAGESKREKRVIKELTNGRRIEYKGKDHEYEVLLVGGFDQKTWLPHRQLKGMGFEKAMKAVDERISAMASNFSRPLTSQFIEKHIGDVGLEAEFATHTRMAALSGGQKVKVVLAAALWKCPHLVIIDEPTNYLDRESLGALVTAINEFEGGVVIISHNNEFCKACCPETWVLENHRLNVQGDPEWLAQAEKEKVKLAQIDEEDLRDAFGNTVKLVTKKKATRQEMKKLRKKIADMRKAGQEVYTDDEMEAMGYVEE